MILQQKKSLRVVSMVPSLTETLLAAGITVVGRTRYCIHPAKLVRNIPIVGGTKQARWDRIRQLNPDFIVLDKEENPATFLEDSPIRAAVVHFTDIASAGAEFSKLATLLDSVGLQNLADRYEGLRMKAPAQCIDEKTIPGFLKWLRQPMTAPKKILYLIWQDPWMTIGRETFIGSALDYCGAEAWLHEFTEKYPKVDLARYDPNETLLLCATEPFPFARKNSEVLSLPFSSALVDGEALSWFGIRNINYMTGF